MKTIFLLCALLIIHIPGYAQSKDTLNIFFPLDKNNLTDASAKFIDSLIQQKTLAPGRKIIVLGYGDYLGSDAYNADLSYARAKSVQNYLTLSGFSPQDITLCSGKGKIGRPALNSSKGNSKDRKVELIINKIIDTPVADRFNYTLMGLHDSETMILKNIHFYQGSLGITPSSLPELKMLRNFMEQNKTYIIQIEGHVCCLGPVEGVNVDEPYNESTLSQKRAEEIRDSLVKYGIDRTRLRCIGLGNSNLIRDEETGAENEELSRRVEVRVISK